MESNTPTNYKLSDFKLLEVLNSNYEHKYISLLGKFNEGEDRAVVCLYKDAFDLDLDFNSIFANFDNVECVHNNDCYYKFNIVSNESKLNKITTKVVYPAPNQVIEKYRQSQFKLVKETPEVWEKITKPHTDAIPKKKWSWIYNILDNGAEAEKTFYKDKDPKTGFTLCLDLAAGAEIKENFHCLALAEDKTLLSLRDLNQEHIPLLEKMGTDGRKAVAKHFDVPEDQIRCYFHYHPSFYHLHLHYAHVMHLAYGVTTERAHMLTTVIDNIKMIPNYYEKCTIQYPLWESDPFYKFILEECNKLNIEIC